MPNSDEEIIDRVDDNDKVIGQMTRKEKENNSYNFRVSIICVFNSKGDILLGKRPMHMGHAPGKWACFGGHVHSNETYENAANRELKEELGFDSKLKNIGKFTQINPGNVKVFSSVFYTEKDNEFIPDKREIEELKFFTKEEINEMLENLSKPTLKSLRLLKKQNLI